MHACMLHPVPASTEAPGWCSRGPGAWLERWGINAVRACACACCCAVAVFPLTLFCLNSFWFYKIWRGIYKHFFGKKKDKKE